MGKKTISLGPKLIEMLDKIREHHMEKGLESFSYCQAGEFLVYKILLAGGLKLN